MIEKQIDIHTADGTASAFLYQPEAGRRCPGVIHLTDIGGIRPAQQEMARRLASEGYAVLVPNVFYRTRKPPVFDFPAEAGPAKSGLSKSGPSRSGPANLGDERMKRVAELSAPLTSEAMERDACCLRRLSCGAQFCQPGRDRRGGLLPYRQDGSVHRQGAAGQDSRRCVVPRRQAC